MRNFLELLQKLSSLRVREDDLIYLYVQRNGDSSWIITIKADFPKPGFWRKVEIRDSFEEIERLAKRKEIEGGFFRAGLRFMKVIRKGKKRKSFAVVLELETNQKPELPLLKKSDRQENVIHLDVYSFDILDLPT